MTQRRSTELTGCNKVSTYELHRFFDLRVISFEVCFDKVGYIFDDAFALWKRKKKNRHPEGQRSIQSYFEQEAKHVASEEGQAIDGIADAPDLQVESATSSTEDGIVGEAVERPFLEGAGSSNTYFSDIGVCWKGYSESVRPQWNP